MGYSFVWYFLLTVRYEMALPWDMMRRNVMYLLYLVDGRELSYGYSYYICSEQHNTEGRQLLMLLGNVHPVGF